ncbi:MAG: DNA-protecting protein DprA [Flavobacteriales bacterium]|nr:DNA-protecting protein DprA [Flavobacteriales bacterium]
MKDAAETDPAMARVLGDPEGWLLDWLTAAQLPKFNGKGTLRVVREVGLGAWLSGFSPLLLNPARDRALRQREHMREEGVTPLILGRVGYPHLLAQLPDAPWVLFAKGDVEVLSRRRPVAVVGTRKASVVGRSAVEALFDGMTGVDWTLVSGMADGIDAAAHRFALDRGVKTVACLAHGLHAVSPRSNRYLAERVLEDGGCWVSEYRWGTPPSKYTFPARNRIIAGLVEAVVVVESGDPGGSLITARLGQDYDRRVFAMSPTWCAEAMRGNARLIREQVAELLHAPEDFPLAMAWKAAARARPDFADEAVGEAHLLDLLKALDPYSATPFDVLVEGVQWDPKALREQLLQAELEGWVRCWPGDRYTRTLR